MELGVSLNPSSKEGYLVPFWVKGKNVCQLILDYRCKIRLARDNGVVLDAWSDIVYDDDISWQVVRGDNPRIDHEPNMLRKPDITRMLFAYAVALLPNGTSHYEVLRLDEIQDLYNKAKKKGGDYFDGSPWNTDKQQMIRKSAVNRLFNQIGFGGSGKFARAMEIDYRDEYAPVVNSVEDGEPTTPTRGVDALKSKLTGAQPQTPASPENSQTAKEVETVTDALLERKNKAKQGLVDAGVTTKDQATSILEGNFVPFAQWGERELGLIEAWIKQFDEVKNSDGTEEVVATVGGELSEEPLDDEKYKLLNGFTDVGGDLAWMNRNCNKRYEKYTNITDAFRKLVPNDAKRIDMFIQIEKAKVAEKKVA
jgi:recombinational DNA repair protein RecT